MLHSMNEQTLKWIQNKVNKLQSKGETKTYMENKEVSVMDLIFMLVKMAFVMEITKHFMSVFRTQTKQNFFNFRLFIAK